MAYTLEQKLKKDEKKIQRIKEDLIDAWDEARSNAAQDAWFVDAFGSTDGNTDVFQGMRDEF